MGNVTTILAMMNVPSWVDSGIGGSVQAGLARVVRKDEKELKRKELASSELEVRPSISPSKSNPLVLRDISGIPDT